MMAHLVYSDFPDCRVARNEAGEISSICHSSTEISSLEVDVAESLFAELQSRVHEYTEEKKGKICLFGEGGKLILLCKFVSRLERKGKFLQNTC